MKNTTVTMIATVLFALFGFGLAELLSLILIAGTVTYFVRQWTSEKNRVGGETTRSDVGLLDAITPQRIRWALEIIAFLMALNLFRGIYRNFAKGQISYPTFAVLLSALIILMAGRGWYLWRRRKQGPRES
ncbi:MAG: hypothetical protein KF708_19695 [Pirellulales bacterium]|nr:hypothetical protein [Pirellulales bacterium]